MTFGIYLLVNLVPMVAIFSVVGVKGAGAKEWGYNKEEGVDPAHWSDISQFCGDETKQSPIDITSSKNDNSLDSIFFHGYDSLPPSVIAKHDGHTVRIITSGNLSISGGSLGGTFAFNDLHFHWGENDTVGSEHGIDGKTYSLEMHFVHWNSDKYFNFSEASTKPDGLAVLAVMAAVVNDSNKKLDKALGEITGFFSSIHFYQNFTEMKPFKFQDLFPEDLQYYRYQGSLTTPPCLETVTWTVFKNPIYITHDQAQEFRLFHEKNYTLHDIVHTNRPFQKIGDRTILLSRSFNAASQTNSDVRHFQLMLVVVLWILM